MQNLPDAQFCSQCEYTLDTEAFLKAREEAEEMKKKIEEVKAELDQNSREGFENDVELKNFIVDIAKALVAMEGPRKSVEKLYNKINEYEIEIAAIEEERRKLAEQRRVAERQS
jgi:NAD(P)H-flavin reductase